jgi:hypothetical protein
MEKKKFFVETVLTFVEAHVVEATDEEQAKLIAQNADSSASKFLSQQVSMISDFQEHHIARLKQMDPYYFHGYATVDENGYLVYMKPDGTVNGNMPKTKIVE